MFDTHCHLNFNAFHSTLPEVIYEARKAGVTKMVVPGTDVATSRKALEIAENEDGIFAAAGIHPHHVFETFVKLAEDKTNLDTIMNEDIAELREILSHPKVIAVGEAGLDRHMYVKTKYKEYTVTDEFVAVQLEVFKTQIKLALELDKALIVHNREAKSEVLAAIEELWDAKLEQRVVIHCCEPDSEILSFAEKHKLFIGVDGDITYTDAAVSGGIKKEFIAGVPHHMLVLETDTPFLLPEPLRTKKKYPNKPENVVLVAQAVAEAWNKNVKEVERITDQNAMKLFRLT